MPKVIKAFALTGFILLLAACGQKENTAQVEAPARFNTSTPLPTLTPSATPLTSPSDTPAVTPTDAGSNADVVAENVVWNPTTTLGNGSVNRVYWTPDGTHLIASGGGGLYWLSFDPMVDAIQQRLPDYFAPLAFVEAGIFAVDADGQITLLDADLNPTPIADSSGAWSNLILAPDGATLAAQGDNEILLMDVASLEIQRRIRFDTASEHLLDIEYGPDGVLLALLTHVPDFNSLLNADTFVRLVEAETDVQRWSMEGPVSQSARADLNGQYLRVSAPLLAPNPADFGFRFAPSSLYDLTTFTLLESVTLRDYWRIAVSHDGSRLASQSNSNGWLIVQDVPAGRQLMEIPVTGTANIAGGENPNAALDMQFSPDDTQMALLSGSGLLIVVDMVNEGQGVIYTKFNSAIHALTFAPDGSTLAVGIVNNTRLYPLAEADPDTPLYTPLPQSGRVISMAYSPDGTRLATGSSGDAALLWDVATGEQTNRLNGVDYSQFLAYLPDGTRMVNGGAYFDNGFSAASATGAFRTWDMTGIPILPAYADVESMKGDPRAFALAPDGAYLAIASYNGSAATNSLTIYDPAEGMTLSEITLTGYTITELVFAEDSRHLYVAGDDGYIRAFDISPDATQLAEYALPTPSDITALALYDGVLVVGQSDGGLTWLSIAEENAGAVLFNQPLAHRGGVTALAFSADGLLASGGVDGLTQVWQIGPTEVAVATDATPVPVANTSAVTYVEKAHYGEGSVNGVYFVPDGEQLVMVASNGASIYRLPDFSAPLFTIPNINGAVAISPDGKWLVGVAHSMDGAGRPDITAYSTTAEPITLDTNFDYVSAVHFAPDGNTLAVVGSRYFGERAIDVYSFPAGEILQSFSYDGEDIAGVAYLAPDELLIALFTAVGIDDTDPQDAPLRIVEAFSGEERLALMLPPVAWVEAEFTPDATHMHLNAYAMGEVMPGGGYTLNQINEPLVRRVVDGQSVDLPGETAPIFTFSNDSRLYAFLSFSEQAGIRIVDLASGEVVNEIDVRGNEGRRGQFFSSTRALWFSPDDTLLAILASDGSLSLMEVASGMEVARSSPGGSQPIQALALSPDGRYIVSGSSSNLQLWDTETGSMATASFAFAPVSVLEFSPTGQQVGVGTLGGNGAVWNFPLLLEPAEDGSGGLPFGADRVGLNGLDYVLAVAYNSDGTRLVTAGYYPRRRDDRIPLIRTWDLTTTPMPLPAAPDIEDLPGVPSAIALSPNGQTLVVATEASGEILLFNAATSQDLGELVGENTSGIVNMAFLPDGRQLMVLYRDGGLAVFDVASLTLRLEWPGTLQADADGLLTTFYQSMTLSADGTQVVGGRNDGLLTIWDAATGGVITEFQAAVMGISEVRFDLTGQLIIGGDDGVIRVWGVE